MADLRELCWWFVGFRTLVYGPAASGVPQLGQVAVPVREGLTGEGVYAVTYNTWRPWLNWWL